MAAKMTRCFCSSFEFGVFDVERDDEYTTGCTQSTTRIFAMGHDAKLVGYMVRAEMNGEEIRLGSITFFGAVKAAASISDALAIKAQAQLDAARARIAKKAAREANKTARQSAKVVEAAQPTTREATIKVGRWEYAATIDIATGAATFTNKNGTQFTKEAGTFKEM